MAYDPKNPADFQKLLKENSELSKKVAVQQEKITRLEQENAKLTKKKARKSTTTA